jgi:catechol 2,3-dioxygenase-like lactoylglutathione lyase family enzyme
LLDHLTLNVSDYTTSKAFYEQALTTLGYELRHDSATSREAGFVAGESPSLWVTERTPVCVGVHIAIRCENRADVEAFHQAACAAGGTDNGGPGIRDAYHANYYGAYVLDPDGNNVEAVCHSAEG